MGEQQDNKLVDWASRLSAVRASLSDVREAIDLIFSQLDWVGEHYIESGFESSVRGELKTDIERLLMQLDADTVMYLDDFVRHIGDGGSGCPVVDALERDVFKQGDNR